MRNYTRLTKRFLSIGGVIFYGMLIWGSASSRAVTEERYLPNFDYTSETRESTKSTGLTIALVNPNFAGNQNEGTAPPYSEFLANMGDDFEEMLIARGFSIRGPFTSRDDMVYNDKKDSDIVLVVDIDLKRDQSEFVRRDVSLGSTPRYRYSGTFYHYGNVNLTAVSPIKAEKLWKKTISLKKTPIVAESSVSWNGTPTWRQLLTDNSIYNPTAKALEEFYQEILATAHRHLEPEELKLVSKEAKIVDGS